MLEVGDVLNVIEIEVQVCEIVEYCVQVVKDKCVVVGVVIMLEQLMQKVKDDENVFEMLILVKVDVQGFVEVIVQVMEKIGNDEVCVCVLYLGVGVIIEIDIGLVEVFGVLVMGFNVWVNILVCNIVN